MTEPEIFDRFPVAVTLSLGDMCLVQHAVQKELSCCKQASASGEHHASLRCKWYEEILASVGEANRKGEEAYHSAWDAYEKAWKGDG
jgi:hypothetical protein